MPTFLDEIANVDPGAGVGQKLDGVAGTGAVRMKSVSTDYSRQNLGLLWILEFELLTDSWGEHHEVGAVRSKVYKPENGAWKVLQQQSIRAHVLCCHGMDPQQKYDKEEVKRMVSAALEGDLDGCIVNLQTIPATAKNGREHTLHVWRPYRPGQKTIKWQDFEEKQRITLPEGWLQHPSDPQYAWHPQTREVKLIDDLIHRQ